jgi:hypothetical protein
MTHFLTFSAFCFLAPLSPTKVKLTAIITTLCQLPMLLTHLLKPRLRQSETRSIHGDFDITVPWDVTPCTLTVTNLK